MISKIRINLKMIRQTNHKTSKLTPMMISTPEKNQKLKKLKIKIVKLKLKAYFKHIKKN